MPHKHTRRKDGDDSHFDLPPSSVAKPLSAFRQNVQDKINPQSRRQNQQVQNNKRRQKTRKGYNEDDTPREFTRMMQKQQSGKKRRPDLDNGERPRLSKRQKKSEVTDQSLKSGQAEKPEVPNIMPGERLGDFAARVDHALPLAGLGRRGKTKVEGVKERQTKTEKRLHKMYAAWREEDARRKEKVEELQEQEEEAEEERQAALGGQSLEITSSNKVRRKRMIGENKDHDDPWAHLKLERRGQQGLHDVVQAPPTLQAQKEKFKVKNGAKVDVANVPTAAGSLKRREELSDARKEVIERYRSMMRNGSISRSL